MEETIEGHEIRVRRYDGGLGPDETCYTCECGYGLGSDEDGRAWLNLEAEYEAHLEEIGVGA